MRVPVGIAAPTAGLVARGLHATWRYRLAAPAVERRPSGRLEPAVYALWHEHLLPLSLLHAGTGAGVLVSRHRDGEILARILHDLGYRPVRGSSSRGGAAGLRRMIELGREGRPLAFTPDGPRGPARTPKAGAVRTAAATGLPLVPVAAAATRGWRLGSWDGFLVPAPAAAVYVGYGDPLTVPPELPEAGLRRWTRRMGEAIDAQAARCEETVGRLAPATAGEPGGREPSEPGGRA